MLLKLLPEQISRYWDVIKLTIQDTAPEISSYGLTVVLENLLCDQMQCWVETKSGVEDPEAEAIVVTTVFRDSFYQQNCLRICSLYGFSDLSPEQWMRGADTIISYARERGCFLLEAITDREGLLKYAERFGCKTRHYISLEV